ncbi:MAG TPA: DUF3784 domain-containing protein [Cyclobacteriaceae bacterium]|nr:DUF3784 domain-containing protein [Cyclobacteriaceae bacterium]
MHHPLITSTILIATGIAVKIFPNLIAGYNTMPPDQKKNVDIGALSSFVRAAFISMGLLIPITSYLMVATGYKQVSGLATFFILIPGVIFTIVWAQRYDHNK